MRLVATYDADHQPAEDRGDELRNDVGPELVGRHPSPDKDGCAYGWVEMSARYVAAGEDQDHQSRADGQRRQGAGPGFVRGHPNREYEHEHSDELDRQLLVKRMDHGAPLFVEGR